MKAEDVTDTLNLALIASGCDQATERQRPRCKPVMAPKYTGLHALRHFYASLCINRLEDGGLGLPPKLVQDRLSHSSIQMTLDMYSHLFPKGDDEGAMDNAASALLAV